MQGSLIKHFIGQWLYDTDCFNGLHDRKLCVLGLCMLLKLLPQLPDIGEYVPKIYPSLIMLFDGLKRAYEAAKDDEDSDDDSDEDDEDDAGTYLQGVSSLSGVFENDLRACKV